MVAGLGPWSVALSVGVAAGARVAIGAALEPSEPSPRPLGLRPHLRNERPERQLQVHPMNICPICGHREPFCHHLLIWLQHRLEESLHSLGSPAPIPPAPLFPPPAPPAQSVLPVPFRPRSLLPQPFLPQSLLPPSLRPRSLLPQPFLPRSLLRPSLRPRSLLPLPPCPSSTARPGRKRHHARERPAGARWHRPLSVSPTRLHWLLQLKKWSGARPPTTRRLWIGLLPSMMRRSPWIGAPRKTGSTLKEDPGPVNHALPSDTVAYNIKGVLRSLQLIRG
uniref:Uncharacterized protein n=1 Tax=Pogona vitticeps TaxID=103695 RepID=A0ABM5EMG2_9SAUR